MTEKQATHDKLADYTGLFWERHFGERPEQIQTLLRPPFLVIHLTGFLFPSEQMLIAQGKEDKVRETRNLLVGALKNDLLIGLQEYADRTLHDLYVDWHLETGTAMLIASMENGAADHEFPWPASVDEDAVREVVLLNSMRTQKKPDTTNFYWLSEHLLLVERKGILVEIEKNLIRNGIIEELRLAKRPLEHDIVKLFNLDALLGKKVMELFVDWNFQEDLSYMVLMLDKHQA